MNEEIEFEFNDKMKGINELGSISPNYMHGGR